MWQLLVVVPVVAEVLLGDAKNHGTAERVATYVSKWNDVEPLYHSYAQIIDEVKGMKNSCKDAGVEMSVHTHQNDDVSMDVIHLKMQPQKNENRFRMGAVFGEHPRELISPETGLATLNALCATEKSKKECATCSDSHQAAHASFLAQAEEIRGRPMDWQIVLNANPNTRAHLEKEGDFCARTSPEGIDLNRNWDDKFDAVGDHGSKAFSAPETDLYRKRLNEFKPQAFLSVHSGQLSMYGPHAWSTSPEDEKLPEFSVLKKINPLCAECTVGPAGRLQGHAITGSSFDWVRDKLGAAYSYAFEIYINSNADVSDGGNGCFRYFNPPNADSYAHTTNSFGNAILQTAKLSMDHSAAAAGNNAALVELDGAKDANMRVAQLESKEEPSVYDDPVN